MTAISSKGPRTGRWQPRKLSPGSDGTHVCSKAVVKWWTNDGGTLGRELNEAALLPPHVEAAIIALPLTPEMLPWSAPPGHRTRVGILNAKMIP